MSMRFSPVTFRPFMAKVFIKLMKFDKDLSHERSKHYRWKSYAHVKEHFIFQLNFLSWRNQMFFQMWFGTWLRVLFYGMFQVAIGLGITTRGLQDISATRVPTELPFFKRLLPSVCSTCSYGFDYHIYMGHDHNDPFFHFNNSHVLFTQYFQVISLLIGFNLKLSRRLVIQKSVSFLWLTLFGGLNPLGLEDLNLKTPLKSRNKLKADVWSITKNWAQMELIGRFDGGFSETQSGRVLNIGPTSI